MEEQEDPQHGPTDPLLRSGAFIDPNPTPRPIPNGNSNPILSSRTPKPDSMGPTSDPQTPLNRPPDQAGGSGPGPTSFETPPSARPDWLPPNWTFYERVRTSGATAGMRDKYFVDPVTNRRFRSKKEVFTYLESGVVPPKKKKIANFDVDDTPLKSATPKRKKGEQVRDITKYFNFDDIPAKVKWELTDVYEGAWRPILNDSEKVPEITKQDWVAAFTHLALQNSGR